MNPHSPHVRPNLISPDWSAVLSRYAFPQWRSYLYRDDLPGYTSLDSNGSSHLPQHASVLHAAHEDRRHLSPCVQCHGLAEHGSLGGSMESTIQKDHLRFRPKRCWIYWPDADLTHSQKTQSWSKVKKNGHWWLMMMSNLNVRVVLEVGWVCGWLGDRKRDKLARTSLLTTRHDHQRVFHLAPWESCWPAMHCPLSIILITHW